MTIQETLAESPDETLKAWQQVYAGCAEDEIAQIEAIALDRSRFIENVNHFRRIPGLPIKS